MSRVPTHERILVTGAAGFIGSHLVERLLSLGVTVTGVDNFDPFYPAELKRANIARALRNPRFELLEVDCADLQGLTRALAGEPYDAIVHLAAKAGVRPSLRDPAGYLRANVVATQNILDLAVKRDIRRVVFGSSSSVYGNSDAVPFSEANRADRPVSPYAASKRSAELLCATYNHLYGVSTVALRFFTVYGPRQRPDLAIRKFASLMLRRAEIPLYGDGTTERDYTWIEDVIDGVVAAIRRTSDVPGCFDLINLGGNRTTSLTRLVELLADALNVEPQVVRLPMQPGDVVRTCADVTKAHQLLGYVPATPVEVGIPRFVEWLRATEMDRLVPRADGRVEEPAPASGDRYVPIAPPA
ncbi:MAG TPA: NAD-dependent epimerase/dehydratase family protein [Gemmatimonadaceae bacterium]|nr:NAD-dependent epimerase/dehydratase family protein [Gemmatimonadaceae bacterium]